MSCVLLFYRHYCLVGTPELAVAAGAFYYIIKLYLVMLADIYIYIYIYYCIIPYY
jgi:hypothetical protein